MHKGEPSACHPPTPDNGPSSATSIYEIACREVSQFSLYFSLFHYEVTHTTRFEALSHSGTGSSHPMRHPYFTPLAYSRSNATLLQCL
jgi:hypothetical protein